MDLVFRMQLMSGETVLCPCCSRLSRLWKMRIHATLAAMLCRMYFVSMRSYALPDGWVHLDHFKEKSTTGNDFSIVKHWGLAIPRPAEDDPEKNSFGFWRLRQRGVSFVENKEKIEKYLWIFDDKVMKKSEDDADIIECLGKKFNYETLFERTEND